MSKRKRTVSLAIRPAAKKARVRKSAIDGGADGLYAQVFAGDSNLDDVAGNWVTSFHADNAQAVAQLVNFVLRCSGCTIKIDEHDIEDPDNCPNRLAEIQDEYQAQDISDYPLIAKNRGATAFKQALRGFFVSFIQAIAQSGLLYENTVLMDNVQAWICTMTSASNRPFRHTSTVASFAIVTALCGVASDIVEDTAKKNRQSEGEAKKSRVNKARVAALSKEIDELNQKLKLVTDTITEWYDSVYVHRYRDVDPKIRVECVEAMSDWIETYPDKFFESNHLRYMGWLLSDIVSTTRVEVLKRLQRLYSDNNMLAGLKHFTERFRPRIVEMATKDAETSVRAEAVKLLDILREAGFLEPDDVDSVGRLVFDAEPRVRKAVVGFFAETINSVYEQQVEDMGGQEALDEALGEHDEDEEYANPRLEWLKLKCLVEQLVAYNSAETESPTEEAPTQLERLNPSGTNLSLIAAGFESNVSLAMQALYDAIPEVRSWKVLAGYLLYDHSQTVQNGGGEDAEAMLQQNCKLDEREETILLDVLVASVKTHLQRLEESQKEKKKTKAEKEALQEEHAETVKQLSNVIPKLLKKFGALPDAASLCLRLARQLDLDIFQELRQNAALTALLDDVNRQFLSHSDEHVLDEAIESILHALTHEDSREAAEAKVQALWDDLIGTFDAIRGDHNLSTRGNLPTNGLKALSHTILKMSKLAKVSEPTVLDRVPNAPASRKSYSKKAPAKEPPISSLLQILDRGVPAEDMEEEVDLAEESLVRHALGATTFYFAWKCRHFAQCIQSSTPISEGDIDNIAGRRDACIRSLVQIMSSRRGADDVRLEAAFLLLDVANMFYALQNAKKKAHEGENEGQEQEEPDEQTEDWQALVQKIDAPTTKLLLQILTAAETQLAKLLHKQVEEPDVDDDPIDPDDPESSEDEEGDEGSAKRSEKHVRTLLATGRLCFLGSRMVHGVRVGTLDKSVKKRLERNKANLGHDWKEVVSHLSEGKEPAALKPQRSKAPKVAKPRATPKARAKAKPKPKPKPKRKSRNWESEDEDEDEDEVSEEEEELVEELEEDPIEDDEA